jgi:hypothetical protein
MLLSGISVPSSPLAQSSLRRPGASWLAVFNLRVTKIKLLKRLKLYKIERYKKN